MLAAPIVALRTERDFPIPAGPTVFIVARYVYDEEASAALHMDVVDEVDDSPP